MAATGMEANRCAVQNPPILLEDICGQCLHGRDESFPWVAHMCVLKFNTFMEEMKAFLGLLTCVFSSSVPSWKR